MHARISALAIAATLAASGTAMAMPGTAMTELALRAGPGPMHPIVGTINANAAVDIAGCTQDGQWCQVSWQGRNGWAYAPYLGMQQQGQMIVVPQARQAVQIPTVTCTERRASTAPSGGQATGTVGGVIAGAATGTVIDPPREVRTYVTTNRVDPVHLQGEVVVGASLPPTIKVYDIPDYQYRCASVNGTTVLVEPGTNKIVYVYR